MNEQPQQTQQNLTIFDQKREQLKCMWENKVPVKITLKQSENEQKQAYPLFLLINRIHYPIVYFEQIHEFFNFFTEKKAQDIHLFYNNKEIPWGSPFGVFVDHHTNIQKLDEQDTYEPLELQLVYIDNPMDKQYENFPGQKKNMQNGKKMNKGLKMWCLNMKQYLFIRYGYTLVDNFMISLPPEVQNELWQEQIRPDYSQKFFDIFNHNFENPKEKEKLQQKNELFEKIPLRIYVQGEEGRHEHGVELDKYQKLGEWIHDFYKGELGVWNKETEEFDISGNKEEYKNFMIYTHGIQIDFDIPLRYLLNYLMYLDGFCYIQFTF